MNILLVLMVFCVVALIDLRPLIRERQKKELVVYCSMFAAVLALWILHVLGVNIPSPMLIAGNFLKDVLRLSY